MKSVRNLLSYLRYKYRFFKLTRALRPYSDIKIIVHKLLEPQWFGPDGPDTRIDHTLPIQLAFRGVYQLGIYLDGPRIAVYTYSGNASTFVVAHLIQVLSRVGSFDIRGVYSYREATEIPPPPTFKPTLDKSGKVRRQLSLVKE